MVELVIAVYPSIEAGFSKALPTLCIPTDYSLGWLPTTEERAASRRWGENTPTSSLPTPWCPSWDPVHHVALFCILQPRKALSEDLVCTQLIHLPPSKMPRHQPAHASPFGSQAPTPWTTVQSQGYRTKSADLLPHKANNPRPFEKETKIDS